MKSTSWIWAVVIVVVIIVVGGLLLYRATTHAPTDAGNVTNTQTSASAPATTSGGSSSLPAIASSTIPIPAVSQAIYNGLQTNLNAYDAEVDQTWNGDTYSVSYGTELISANCNRGTALLTGLQNGLAQVQGELTGLQALGVKSVVICIGYPMLDPTFWNSPSVNQPARYSQFITYYQDVVQAIHQKNMKVVVESDALFTTGVPTDLISELNAYYQSLSFAEFEKERAAEEMVTASEIKPDYLLIQTEPSSEAYQAHRPELNDPTQDVAMVNSIVSTLDAANIPGLHTSIIIGSGFGSWQSEWQSYLSGLLKIQGLDLIDTHNYFTSGGDIDNELSIISQARQAGKQLGMSEYWLKKSLAPAPSLTTPNFSDADDNYSFWAPLDQQFIQLMYIIANENHFAYTSAFNDLQMFAYLDYNQTQSQICGGNPCTKADNAKITSAVDQMATQGFKSGELTTTGSFFKDLITK